ncbi:MAG: aspartate-semialdehyde dehydrogenase [Planctomycetota bacterium]
MKRRSLKVAIAGATGAVGIELLKCLEEASFDVASLDLYASQRSAGRQLSFADQDHEVKELGDRGFGDAELVFLATSAQLSRELAMPAKQAGAFVIDNSSAFRQDPASALIIPELNGHEIPQGSAIVANPNCSTIIALMAVGPLAKRFGLDRLVASTYQAVSGAGTEGLTELEASVAELRNGSPFVPKVFSAPIAENLIPWVGDAETDGWTDEELKMLHESRKILNNKDLEVFCTCVRVPVARAHSISVHVKLAQPATRDEVLALWNEMPGLQHVDDGLAATALTPRRVQTRPDVSCGRLRSIDKEGFEWIFFVVGDQLLKGAAQNAVQIAEHWADARYQS